MSDRTLIDAGPIVAIFSPEDDYHARCDEALGSLSTPLYTCWPVVTEAAYLLRKRPESVERLIASFAGGFLSLLPLDAPDLPVIAAIMRRYENIGSNWPTPPSPTSPTARAYAPSSRSIVGISPSSDSGEIAQSASYRMYSEHRSKNDNSLLK